MADASCGPSNAFKGLARHVEQDRSHQQDRVVPGSHQPAQTFRSTPVNSGAEDQYKAFLEQKAALPDVLSAGLEDLRSPPVQVTPWPQHFTMQQQAAFAQGANSDWVNRFLHMNYSNTPARPLHGQPAQGASSDWVNQFQQMAVSDAQARPFHGQPTQAPVVGQPSIASPMQLQYPVRQHSVFSPYQQPFVGPHYMAQPNLPYSPYGNTIGAPQFKDDTSLASNAKAEADLEQEFANAMEEWMLKNESESDEPTAGLNAASAEPTVREATKEEAHEATEEQVREVTKEESEGTAGQETELARAAQQLVDLLADNDTEKFKNSEFLSLMRRIASRQLTVQGNDLVETSQSPPGTDTAGTASATSHQPGSSDES
ncbi:hypothetical protein F4859DRAFT_473769 [Xylaria cf. heliscus]|nr:hypothetical protein F4859DRAFT_473769 [Xylaria cf. heliscus]